MTAEQAIYEAAELSPAEARAYAMADEAEIDHCDGLAAHEAAMERAGLSMAATWHDQLDTETGW